MKHIQRFLLVVVFGIASGLAFIFGKTFLGKKINPVVTGSDVRYARCAINANPDDRIAIIKTEEGILLIVNQTSNKSTTAVPGGFVTGCGVYGED
jgi:hypothetical protein